MKPRSAHSRRALPNIIIVLANRSSSRFLKRTRSRRQVATSPSGTTRRSKNEEKQQQHHHSQPPSSQMTHSQHKATALDNAEALADGYDTDNHHMFRSSMSDYLKANSLVSGDSGGGGGYSHRLNPNDIRIGGSKAAGGRGGIVASTSQESILNLLTKKLAQNLALRQRRRRANPRPSSRTARRLANFVVV